MFAEAIESRVKVYTYHFLVAHLAREQRKAICFVLVGSRTTKTSVCRENSGAGKRGIAYIARVAGDSSTK